MKHLSQCLRKRDIDLYLLEKIQESRELLFKIRLLEPLREWNLRIVCFNPSFFLRFLFSTCCSCCILFFYLHQQLLNYATSILLQFLHVSLPRFPSSHFICLLVLCYFLELLPCNPSNSSLCHLGMHVTPQNVP